ncbi:RICIN domain-containing protein [Saccharothrix australiensis]|uniref:Ricin-type beta-trefoil lectin protein n=1 Tax=Saccharothrix australiensis TaxID=2072 RepID=A0A495VWF3_9PSEU|nr:RICIN domain-containing protein [Saccharothrix australiensis]RKT53741.1 ricin-type beta-trefoil lectin protein [Saccharothrix australiensis]
MKSRLIRLLAAVALGGWLAAAPTAATAGAAAPDQPAQAAATFLLVAGNSGLCVGPAVGSPHDGAAILQDHCNGHLAAWRWELRSLGGNLVEIRNAGSDRCVDVFLAGRDNGVATIQYGCNGGFHQHWFVTDKGDGYVEFRNRNSGKCLDVAQGFRHLGAPIWQWDCHGGAPQRFKLG